MGTAIVSFGQAGAGSNTAKVHLRSGNPQVTESVTTSGTSAATTAAIAEHGVAIIRPSAQCYAVQGASPTATAGTGWLCPADEWTEIAMIAGNKLALIEG